MKILVIHPGHSFSTSDVFDGLCAGLKMNDVGVVPFTWDRVLRTLGAAITQGAAAAGVPPEQIDKRTEFAGWLAAADALTLAVDEEVDAAIVVNGLLFPPSRVRPLRKFGIPVACFGTEAPYFLNEERQIAPFYDHWFTNERRCVHAFADLTRASYLPHAYNPEIHQWGRGDPDHACDVAFVGGGYPERRALLDGVDWTGIHREVRGTLWQLDLAAERGATDNDRGRRYSEGSIPNSETTAWHRSAAVSLNMHRRMSFVESDAPIAAGSAESLGPRAYEIPAVGGFMLCDDERPEIWDVYDAAPATFRAWDSADLERQVRYWLAHPGERERRRKDMAACVQPHHWGARARTVLETLIT